MMKKNKSPKTTAGKAARRRKLRYGVYATAITAAFVAVIIGLNVVATVLADRFPLQWDVTANSDYSISDENREYIKKIDRDVTVTLCASEEDYTGGNYSALLESSNYVDTSAGMFFEQTVRLLKDYEKLNSKVDITFADPQDPSFSTYTKKYSNESFSLGDILVECSFTLDGEQIDHYKKLTFFDLYDIDNTYYSYYGYYTVSGSKVETAVTSAIYSVTSDKTYQVAVITANGGSTVDSLSDLMLQNNYQFTEIDDLVSQSIPDDTDLVIIAAPSKDYSREQLKMLENYLDLKGKLGKNLMYVASNKYGDMPNLYDFLAEWGFNISDGLVDETDSSYYLSDTAKTVKLLDQGSDYTKAIADGEYSFYCAANSPVTVKWEENENHKTTTVLATNSTAKCDGQNGPFVAVGVGEYAITGLDDSDDEYKEYKSSVIVVSSLDMIETAYNNYPDVGNLELLMATVNETMGRQADDISFTVREYESLTFTTSDSGTVVMRIIFVFVIPLALLAVCIFVTVRRRRL